MIILLAVCCTKNVMSFHCETICCWCRYGIKEVKGVNRLSGAGLETQDAPGMLSGGGKWPGRWVLHTYVRV